MAMRKHRQAAPDSTAGLISMPYCQGFWWFDTCDLYYRLGMTGFLLVCLEDVELRVVACVYISMLFLTFVAFSKPFLNRSHNKVMVAGQFVVSLTISAGYILQTIDGTFRESVGWSEY